MTERERERDFGENLSVFLASNEERVKEKHKGKISLCLWVTSQWSHDKVRGGSSICTAGTDTHYFSVNCDSSVC